MFIFRLILLLTLIMASLVTACFSAVSAIVVYICGIIPSRRERMDVRAMEQAGVPPLVGLKRNKPG